MTHAPLAPIAAVSGSVTLLALQSIAPTAGPSVTVPIAIIAIVASVWLALRSEKARKREAYVKAEKEQIAFNQTVRDALRESEHEHERTRALVTRHVEEMRGSLATVNTKVEEMTEGVSTLVGVFTRQLEPLVEAHKESKALPKRKRK